MNAVLLLSFAMVLVVGCRAAQGPRADQGALETLRRDLVRLGQRLPERKEEAAPMIFGFFRDQNSVLAGLTRNVVEFKRTLFRGFVEVLAEKYNFGYELLHTIFG